MQFAIRCFSSCPLKDSISKIEILPNLSSDLTVVNAARVSFDRASEKFTTIKDKPVGSDESLLNFLARENHWTPFAHPSFTFLRRMGKEQFIRYVSNTEQYQFNRYVFPIEGKSIHFVERGSAYAYIATCIDASKRIEGADCELYPNPFSDETFPIYHMMNDMPYTLIAFAKAKSVQWPTALRLDAIKKCRRVNSSRDLGDSETTGVISIRAKMPIFVERQWFKHTIGFVRSSVSRRYVRNAPDFYFPDAYRLQDQNVKQGSSDLIAPNHSQLHDRVELCVNDSIDAYQTLRDSNVAAEQSRIVFPQNMYTEFIETGTVAAYKRLLGLRLHKTAQKEIRDYATSLLELLSDPQVTEYHSHFKDI